MDSAASNVLKKFSWANMKTALDTIYVKIWWALWTPSSGTLTNCNWTATWLTSGITNALKSATTTIDVSSATAPSSGQVLTATSSTTATWQTLAAAFNGVLCTWTYSVTKSLTAVTFTTESYDTDAFHNNATNTSRLTVPSVALAGKYRITGNIQISAGVNLEMIVRIRKNGSTTICEERFLGWSAGCSCSITCDDLTSNGDYYELMVQYGSAQTANVRFGWNRMG